LIRLSIWLDIRSRHTDGESIKEIARATGSSKNTVKKYLRADVPPSKAKLPDRKSSMARFQSEVDGLLRDSPTIRSPRIVRIIQERLDASFRIGERSARQYVSARRSLLVTKEVFIRLVFAPGDQMQIDFKDLTVILDGIETKLHMFVARLNYSTRWFACCYQTEDRPALFDGILAACQSFGGVPREAVFDNASSAVTKILRGRDRALNTEFAEFCGSLRLTVQFAAPAKGNEKGGVEGLHGFIEDNVFVPRLAGPTLVSINITLASFCQDDSSRRVVSGEPVSTRFERESLALRPLPAIPPSPCIREFVRVNKFSEVTHKTNRYSVPSEYANGDAFVECYANSVTIVVGSNAVASHPRCFGKHQSILDPLHFIDVLEHKHRAVEYAAMFADERFPESLRALLRRYVEDDRLNAGKNFMRIVKLLKANTFEDVIAAVECARLGGTNDPSSIELLLGQQVTRPPSCVPLPIASTVVGAKRPKSDLNVYAIAAIKEVA
jgi:transposase